MCTCFQAASWTSWIGLGKPAGVGLLGLGSAPAPERCDLSLPGLSVVNPGWERIDDATLEVRGDRIARLERGRPDHASEFSGCFAMPGLIDMHVHAPPPLRDLFARLQLLHGVTAVRNTGDGLDVFSYREQVRSGERQGPRIFACGPPLDGRPTAFPFATAALEDPQRARVFVGKLADRGADFLKAFINLTPAVLQAIREEADLRGLRVAGHVPRFNRIEDAGVVDIQHLTGVPDHPSTAFALDGAFKPWVKAWATFGSQRRDHVVECSHSQGIAHTPTLVLWKGLARAARGSSLNPPRGLSLMPEPYVEAFWRTKRPPVPYVRGVDQQLFEDVERALPTMSALIRDLDSAGVRLLAGTDTINPWVVPGASLHEEVELLADAGMTPERALVCATRDAAAALGAEDLGRLRAGGLADLLILRKDPTQDLAHLDSIEAVVADGRLYRVAALREAHESARSVLSAGVVRLAGPILAKLVVSALSALPAPVPHAPPS